MTLGSIAIHLPAINRGFATSVAEMQHERGARACDPDPSMMDPAFVDAAVGVRSMRVGDVIGQAANFYGAALRSISRLNAAATAGIGRGIGANT